MAKKKEAPKITYSLTVLPETLREQVGKQALNYIENTLGFDLTDPGSPIYTSAMLPDADANELTALRESWNTLFTSMGQEAQDTWEKYDIDGDLALVGKLVQVCFRAEELGRHMYDTWGVQYKGTVDVMPKPQAVPVAKNVSNKTYLDATEQALGWGRVGIHLIWALAKEQVDLQKEWHQECKELQNDLLELQAETEIHQWMSGVVRIVNAVCDIMHAQDPDTGYLITSVGWPERRDAILEWLQDAASGAVASRKVHETEEQLLEAQNSLISVKNALDRASEGLTQASVKIRELETENDTLLARLERQNTTPASETPGMIWRIKDLERRNLELEKQAADLLLLSAASAPAPAPAASQNDAFLLAFIRELAANTGYGHPGLSDDFNSSKEAIEAIRQRMQDI